MITFLDRFYSKLSVNNFFIRAFRYFIRVFTNMYVYIFMKAHDINREVNDKTIIVSLTSYPARINTLWLVIKTLLAQKGIDNYKVILWLSKIQFPKEMESLPSQLTCLISKGLDIRFVDDDLRSHKKYYYAFKEYPENIVVTVDDDILYPSTLLKTLVEAHENFSRCIICNRGTIINKTAYRSWNQVKSYMSPESDILPTGVGGVLYPPHCYHEDIFDADAIKNTCIYGDDLWLNLMCRLNGTKIVHTGVNLGLISVLSSQSTALCNANIGDNRNDAQIAALNKWAQKYHCSGFYYGVGLSNLK